MSDSLKGGLEKLAESLLEDAKRDGTKIDAKVDIFKAVSAFYLGTARASKGSQQDGGDMPTTFGSIRNRIHTGGSA